ncbi:MAG: hypothetical protein ACI80V_003810 [Rhodothermales bacterium]
MGAKIRLASAILSRILRICLAFLLILTFAASGARAQDSFFWYPVLKPHYFYSPSAGFGAGLGINGQNLLRSGDRSRSRLRLQQFRQSGSVAWASDSPSVGWSGWMATLKGYRHVQEGFYGRGPSSRPSFKRDLNRVELSGEIRRAFSLPGGTWVQPRVLARLDRVVGFGNAHGGEPSGRTLTHLDGLVAAGTSMTVGMGLDLGWSVSPQTLLQAHLDIRRAPQGVRQAVAGVFADRTWLLPNRGRVTARILVDHTLTQSGEVPFYLLPKLDDALAPGWDRFRFYGNDRIVLGATYVHPVLEILKSHVYEGIVHVGLSQVYNDLFSDFSPRVAWAPDRQSFGSGVPLEPTFAIGSQLVARKSGHVLLAATLGISAEGFIATSFQITQRLSGWFPAVR